MKQFSRSALRLLSAPVVPCGCLDVRVPGETLNGRHVSACIEQIRDERPPEIVRRELQDTSLLRATLESNRTA